ncbi:hypothetical protein CDL60_04760 [Roseateles noduli]|nr:hypothetical protein CDL60_04760 [Roseateles noduli]
MLPAMSAALPHFPYHPDPVSTGAVVARKITCLCCEQERDFVYTGPVYRARVETEGRLCPWCIADGSAASRLGVDFGHTHDLMTAGIAREVIEAVELRTPGFFSWQNQSWLPHCDDACAFMGDASLEDVVEASDETRETLKREYAMADDDWAHLIARYTPGGNPAFYEFVCRHCGFVRLGWDCT